ncbi:MAG: Micromonas sp [Verrucomicrobiota bacterium]|jgi:acetolactate synthase-1/2/3 large subunit
MKTKTKVSDIIVRFFEEKGVRHCFGIIGSANAHIFDSICYGSEIELICNHHEQACTMAVQSYWKVTGQPTFALVTAGAGSSNAITGVLSAWADSIPCLIISGQENARYITPDHDRRLYGIQGYDSPYAVSKMTKYATRVMDPLLTLYELEKAWHLATTGRPGPCWIDFPMSVQGTMVEEDSLSHFVPEPECDTATPLTGEALLAEVKSAMDSLHEAERPILWLGVGIRMADSVEEIKTFVEKLGIPALVTWSAIDMLDSCHPLIVGRAGTYGQRAANLILQNCDYLLAIGTRMAIPQIGYEVSELARSAKRITVVDIDATELAKYPERFNHPLHADAGDFIRAALDLAQPPTQDHLAWAKRSGETRARFPWIGEEHADRDGYINIYRFMDKMQAHFKEDQILVTDMGTALLCGHQALSITPPQRLITSQGLGEMGFGLPAAIGASFGRDRGEVICLNCDGGMMMNLQELQTMVHHKLPIKLFVFNNDGYLMIKHTQKAMLQGRYAGTDLASGVSCPDFSKLAYAFGISAWTIRTWEDYNRVIPEILAFDGPCVIEVFMHPEQWFYPKLSLATQKDGTLVSPPLEDLSPLLPRDLLESEMIGGLHPKSAHI